MLLPLRHRITQKENTMSIKDFLKETFIEKNGMVMRSPVICADGFSVSVQASKVHYCSPRTNTDSYLSVELGYPSKADDLILEWAEESTDPTNTVYGYVPIGVVQQLIEKHGGIRLSA